MQYQDHKIDNGEIKVKSTLKYSNLQRYDKSMFANEVYPNLLNLLKRNFLRI